MPARRDYTPDELAARLERRREQTRQAVRRYRQRHKGRVSSTVSATAGPSYKEVTLTPSHTLPVGEPSLLGGEKEVAAILAPFEAARGYLHDVRFLAKLRQKYPGVDLELEALKAADWLMEPRNAKRRCSKAFLDHWLNRAAADRAAPAPNGPYHQPHTQQGRNPGPPDLPRFEGPVQRIEPAELARFVAARADVPLAERVARWKAGPR